jgi:hypothetical protein
MAVIGIDVYVWRYLMRLVMIALLVLALAVAALAQRGKPDDPDQTRQMENAITQRQILELPRRDKAPAMSLQRALKIAEGYIRKERIDITSSYLFEARLILGRAPEESRWAFWWVRVSRNRANDADVRVTVTTSGKVRLQ